MKANTVNCSRLRAVIGWLGLLLPWLCALLVGRIPGSISITYYSNACATFMIVLGAAGILLFCYHGYDWLDDLINTIAAAAGIGVCLFPMTAPGEWGAWPYLGTFPAIPMKVSNILHCTCAAVFFGMLIIDSLFRFTKSTPGVPMSTKKKIRNVIYICCGIGMLMAVIMLAFQSILPIKHLTWWVEMIALFFFGISWLTKADRYAWLAADTPDDIISVTIRRIKWRMADKKCNASEVTQISIDDIGGDTK